MAGIISTTRATDPFANTGVNASALDVADPMAPAQALNEAQNNAPATSLTPLSVNKTDPLTSLSGYTPNTRTLDPVTQTVEGRIQGIVSRENPLVQAARTRVAQTANQRGLVNSSMAVQAGEQAAFASALPIAQADAVIANDVGNRNMDATNRATEFGATTQNTGSLQQAQIQAQGTEARATQAAQETGSRETQLQLQSLRGTQAQDLANIEASFKTLMQTNDSAGKVFQQSLDAIQKIMSSDHTVESKQAEVNAVNEQLKNSLHVFGAVANLPGLSDLLTFNTPLPAAAGGSGAPAGATPPGSSMPPANAPPQPAGTIWSPLYGWVQPDDPRLRADSGSE